jgi:hypothetical protein
MGQKKGIVNYPENRTEELISKALVIKFSTDACYNSNHPAMCEIEQYLKTII